MLTADALLNTAVAFKIDFTQFYKTDFFIIKSTDQNLPRRHEDDMACHLRVSASPSFLHASTTPSERASLTSR
jgi:hypothetical protein